MGKKGLGKPSCELHAGSPNVRHSGGGDLKTRNWVISSVKNCCDVWYQRDLMKMLLRAPASAETMLSYPLSIFIGLQIWDSFM